MNSVNELAPCKSEHVEIAELIRVRGLVQGVGFRPTVWRLAREYGIRGWVENDGQGVRILACGSSLLVASFVEAVRNQPPPLARIEAIEREFSAELPQEDDFRILASQAGHVHTHTDIAPDAAPCPECLKEIFDPFARRYRYPFTNCTHCGPRLSIIEEIPYDRAATTMRKFSLCAACAAEYADPGDRRFHAQPIACPVCGPRAWLQRADGTQVSSESLSARDDIDAACTLIQRGQIVAIKGLGGFQLACDASNGAAVTRLRSRKERERKPFAMMAPNLDIVRRYCAVSDAEAALLLSEASPIVLLDANGTARVADAVAPGMMTLGFMLPNTPLHHLLLQRMERPMVLTSGNLSDEPQCIDNGDALNRLGDIADYFLLHDRDIARRVDDSVVRIMAGEPRTIRRARGYAPTPIRLPEGFDAAPPVLAMGAELKNTFCVLRDGQAILSHHMGDLADARCHADYRQSIDAYQHLFKHEARCIAIDRHPEYLSSKAGRVMAGTANLQIEEVQHHHAHITSCMAENGISLNAGPVIGIALDGLGYGADGSLWGGEFLLADYRQFQRIARFKPVAMPGGEQAIHEPWRNTYAQLMAAMTWERFAAHYDQMDLYRFLMGKPRKLLDGMIAKGINSPLSSSCGRLFDAVAAAAGLCRERVLYEGQAAMEFEALVDQCELATENDDSAYPFALDLGDDGLFCIDSSPLWPALFNDVLRKVPVSLIAARFHKGLAIAIVRMVQTLSIGGASRTVALSGGVFQNRTLLEQVCMRLEQHELKVLTHHRVPANDGGIALGQAATAAARRLAS